MFGLITVAFISGLLIWHFKYDTPSYKVERLERATVKLREKSGFNACIKKIDDKIKKQEEDYNNCVSTKLHEKGYNDGLDCIMKYEDLICKNTERYNAQVNANNDCNDVSNATVDQNTGLSKLDCYKLLENNK